MYFTPVDELPVRVKRTFRKNNGDHLREFLNMRVKYARMNIDEFKYMNVSSAYTSTKKMVEFHGFPIEVKLINQEIYLVNREL